MGEYEDIRTLSSYQRDRANKELECSVGNLGYAMLCYAMLCDAMLGVLAEILLVLPRSVLGDVHVREVKVQPGMGAKRFDKRRGA
jgi:hypothetical protein